MADGLDAFSAAGETPTRDDSIDAERSLIACVLADEDGKHAALARTAELVAPDDFADPRRGTMWGAILAVRKRGEPVDAGTVAEELASRGAAPALKHMGDVAALQVSPAACEHHARRVGEHALARGCAATVADAAAALRGKGSPLERVSAARAALAKMPTTLRGQRDDSIAQGMCELMDSIEAAAEAARLGVQASACWGVDTLDGGFDEDGCWTEGVVGGFFDCELTLIGGLPASGKTTICTQAAEATATTTAKRKGRGVLYFTLEMSRVGLCRRLVAQRAGVSLQRIKRGVVSRDEMAAMGMHSQELARLPIQFIEDCRTVEAIEARVLAEKARGDVGLVVVDYLQLVKMAHRSDDGTRDDQDRVNEFKAIANRARVPVLAITSMTKTGQREAAKGKVDMTAGMGSGAEYAADVMGFLIRTDPDDTSGHPEVRFEFVKTRDGVPSFAMLRFDMARGRFARADGAKRGGYG